MLLDGLIGVILYPKQFLINPNYYTLASFFVFANIVNYGRFKANFSYFFFLRFIYEVSFFKKSNYFLICFFE
jgi:hypothetical protein